MKIAFFHFASSSIHVGAALEILEKESNHSVSHFCYLGNATSYPGRMSQSFSSFSHRFPRKLKKFVRMADPKVIVNSVIKFDKEWVEAALDSLLIQIRDRRSIKDLASLFYDGASPGAALANELTTLTKNREINLDQNIKLVSLLLRSYLEVFNFTSNYLMENRIQKVYIFNGRFLHERATWDATKHCAVKAELFETTRNRYIIREKGFHDRINNQNEMKILWNQSSLSLEKKVEIGSRYFDLLRGSSNPFVNAQEFDTRLVSPYFVYFSNSDDEAVGFWESWNEGLGGQIQVVGALQAFFDSWGGAKLIIRLHPNLQNKSDSQKRDWAQLENTKNSLVIPAESRVSSYKLMDSAQGVITFGSTLGLEAAYAKKPSLLMADSGYDLLDVCDKPISWEYVYEWIRQDYKKSESVLEDRRINACIRGFYLECGGNEFKNSRLKETGWGAWEVTAFKGKTFGNSVVENLVRKVIFKIRFLKITKMIHN